MKKSILFLIYLVPAVAFSQPFKLLKNLDGTLSDSSFDIQPKILGGGNNILYFTATTPAFGTELFKSFADNPGSSLVKDIYPGTQGSDPNIDQGNALVVNDVLYFSAMDSLHGRELWKSDGTASGTIMIKDINPNQESSAPLSLALLNGVLYFAATDPIHGRELWKTDGTEAGTVMVKDIVPGSEWSNPGRLISFNNYVFFLARDPMHGFALWKTDGTEAGTAMVKDIDPGPADSYIYYPTVAGNLLFFSVWRNSRNELFKTDGTEAGTMLVKSNDGPLYPLFLTNLNGILYFQGWTSTNGAELWRSDGTEAGTFMVKDIGSGQYNSNPNSIVTLNNNVYFFAQESAELSRLWKSDGTADGTVPIFTFAPVTQYGPIASSGNNIWISAIDNTHGAELWKSDGTTEGTFFVQDLNPGPNGSNINSITPVSDKLFLIAYPNSPGTNIKIWVGQSSSSTIPVTIVNFKGILQKESVDLYWQSHNEDNVRGFQVQRSVDGVRFYNIGFVNAIGNALTNNYRFKDYSISQTTRKVLYYRLKIFDNDNTSYYSKVVPVVIDKNTVSIMGWPNPAQSEFYLEFNLPERDILTARVYNMQGQLMQRQQFELAPGVHTKTLSVQSLTNGVYTIIIQGKKINWSTKIIKQ